MPLNFSAALSSRISKTPQRKTPLLKRSSSSLFADVPRRKPIQQSQSKPEKLEDDEGFFGERLDDVGLVKALGTDLSLRDVAQSIQYVQSHMFDAIPEAGGFNSVQTAEILNFQKSLPPTVTVAHVHALISAPTKTEKEISELAKAGIIRRMVTPGRGTGGSSIGEGLALSKDIERLVKEAKEVESPLAGAHIPHKNICSTNSPAR